MTPAQLATLSYAVRKMQHREDLPIVTAELAGDILRNTRLPTATEQLDNLVLFLGRELTEPGEGMHLTYDDSRAVIGAKTAQSAGWVIKQALRRDLLQGVAEGNSIKAATLSVEGWQKYGELQTASSRSRRAFMAMQYNDTEMNNVFFDYLKPAAARAGYDLFKLDDEPRAGLIDDRLRLEIRTSRFLVADLSHGNRGAYWEAGYAEGLGRPVIYTCKKSVFEDPDLKPHFDTNHWTTVVWDPEDLQSAADQLTTVIRVTLPSEAKLTDD